MTIYTCYLLIDIKNPVNIWWNEKYLVPLQQKKKAILCFKQVNLVFCFLLFISFTHIACESSMGFFLLYNKVYI